MAKKLNVGIIGCGWAGHEHARGYASLPNVEILAVADIVAKKATDLGRRYGAASHTDYRRLLKNPKIEAVSICLPHDLHAEATIEAAETGKHVLCEKPIAISLSEADAMIEATEKAEVTLMVAENVRFNPVNIELKRLIEQDAIGEVFLARIFRDTKLYDILRDRQWYFDKEKTGGGIWICGAPHEIDALRMLIGEVRSVSLFQTKKMLPEMEGEDTVTAVLKFEGGALGVVTESFSTVVPVNRPPYGCPSAISGSRGTATVSFDGIEIYKEDFGNIRGFEKVLVDQYDTFSEEIRHFADCVTNGKTPITSAEEGRRVLSVICAGYESLARNGVYVEVEY